eukprot:jgi/Botrbrau1/19020/Bobra.0100s0051.2
MPFGLPSGACNQVQNESSEFFGEREYSPSVYLTIGSGYIFFGLTNTNGTVTQSLLHDPALRFPPVAITSIIIARFTEGPFGAADLVTHIVQSSIEYNGKNISSGSIVVAWSSNPRYCNPEGNGALKDRCYLANFKWTPLAENCENLHIYDPSDPNRLLLGFEQLCKSPPIGFFPSTTYTVPRLSAIRLTGFDTIVPVTDGFTEDGHPKIVDHILGDFDEEGFVRLCFLDRITGTAASSIRGFTFPVGNGYIDAKVRWGFNYISPLQQSFAPPLSDGQRI